MKHLLRGLLVAVDASICCNFQSVQAQQPHAGTDPASGQKCAHR